MTEIHHAYLTYSRRQRGDTKHNITFPDTRHPSPFGLMMFDDVATYKPPSQKDSRLKSAPTVTSYIHNEPSIPGSLPLLSHVFQFRTCGENRVRCKDECSAP